MMTKRKKKHFRPQISLQRMLEICQEYFGVFLKGGHIYSAETDPPHKITRSELAQLAFYVVSQTPCDYWFNDILMQIAPEARESVVRTVMERETQIFDSDLEVLESWFGCLLQDVGTGRYPELDPVYFDAISYVAMENACVKKSLLTKLRQLSLDGTDLTTMCPEERLQEWTSDLL